jgi:hypothetical protein
LTADAHSSFSETGTRKRQRRSEKYNERGTMGKRAEFEPHWLVSLLNQWALHDLRSQTGGLGFASGSSWMRGLKSSPASSIDPTGYAARDFRDVEAAMDDLRTTGTNLWAALMMYYRPWAVPAFRDAGYPFQTSTYYERLHRGHSLVALSMNQLRARRLLTIKPLDVTAEVGI